MEVTTHESTRLAIAILTMSLCITFFISGIVVTGTYVSNSTHGVSINNINVNASLIDADYPIIEVENQRVKQNEVFNPMEYVSASDTRYGDLTSSVNVVGEVDTSTKGVYEILYQVRNPLGLKSTKWINVIVD